MYKKELNGPAEGLAKKIDYWKGKDYSLEFNILISQACNLAQADNINGKDTEGSFNFWFNFILEKRADKKLRTKFEEYRWNLEKAQQIKQDKFDEQKNDAELEINADNDLPF